VCRITKCRGSRRRVLEQGSLRDGREAQSPPHRPLARTGDAEYVRRAAAERRHPTVGLYHTEARQRLETVRQDAVVETSVAGYTQNETSWSPWLRTIAGLRVDGYRFNVDASEPENSGTRKSGMVSPKGGGPGEMASPRTVPLTSYVGNESDPALSPDDRQVAFTRDGGPRGVGSLYVKLVDGGDPALRRAPSAAGLRDARSDHSGPLAA